MKKKRLLSILLVFTLVLSCFPGELGKKTGAVKEVEASSELDNPYSESDSSMNAGKKVTWHCIWFGSYPQTEVVAVDAPAASSGKTWSDQYAYIYNIDLYNKLQNASGWNNYQDITLEDGTKYRRVRKMDVDQTSDEDWGYRWTNATEWRYFKYEPVKWRVLRVTDKEALLLSDMVLDMQKFNDVSTYVNITWEKSTVRSWLNGYDSTYNTVGNDYSGIGLIDSMFQNDEKEAIIDTPIVSADKTDKLFLLQASDVSKSTGSPYGFASSATVEDEGRRSKSSSYAKARGTYVDEKGFTWWWLRSHGSDYNSYKQHVYTDGHISDYGISAQSLRWGIRPALILDISRDDLYSSAGNVCSNGEVHEPHFDTDKDGLYDDWEIKGLDTDMDGITDYHLEAMGPDMNVPDIYVQVDSMIKPEKKHLFIKTEEMIDFSPTGEAMRMVYEAFHKKRDDFDYDNGINLHIDAGSNSVDFVTGRKWGKLSESKTIPYEEELTLETDASNWFRIAEENLSWKRRKVFRHAMFINAYSERPTSSGIAIGQYLIVANQDWVRKKGDIGVAGTFMHELGHTLGLHHGGFDDQGNEDHVQHKPNYLSIMNYLFQTRGLAGTNELNYSEYHLPTLNEENLIEEDGIDPKGLTADTTLGTYLVDEGPLVDNISGRGIDFNGDGVVSKLSMKYNLNHDEEEKNKTPIYGKLYSSTDWDHLQFVGGTIGNLDNNHGKALSAGNVYETSELTLEEAMTHKVLSSEVTAAIEAKGPFTIIKDAPGQYISLEITNMHYEDADATIKVKKSEINDEIVQDIKLTGYTDQFNPVSYKIPVKSTTKPGNYTITASVEYKGEMIGEKEISIEVYQPTDKELNDLKDAIDKGEITEEEIPQDIIDIYKNLPDPKTPSADDSANDKKTINVSSVKLSGISTNIAAGKSVQLTASVLPKNAANKKLKWKSSNTKVATVTQKGKVAVKKGTGGKNVTITATAIDGSGKSASFIIKVMKGAVKKVTIKKAKKTLKVGKTMKLKAVVKVTKGKPVNKKVKWISGNIKYATVSSKGVVKALKAGKGKTVKITAMATDGTGKKKVVTIKIK